MIDKRYKMINTNLVDENGRIYYNIQREDGFNICQVYGKYTAKSLIDELNELSDENEQLRKENDMFSCELSVSANKEISRNCRIAELEEENKQLKAILKQFTGSKYNDKMGIN